MLKEVEIEKLCNLAEVQFSIKDDSKFDETIVKGSKIFINKDDFIEIKDKPTLDYVKIFMQQNIDNLSKTDDLKSMIINIPVPKSTSILNEIITRGDIDQLKINEQVKKLEQEINELVYELYGLSKEEIDIIENSLKN